jgi:hypothetical protein
MSRSFDCVASKHAAAQKIRQEIKSLGAGGELKFWKRRSAVLRLRKDKAQKVLC